MNQRPIIVGIILVTLLIGVSIFCRRQELSQVTGTQNLAATYHVLLTLVALDETSARDHLYLPTVTLGRESDKNIRWGATRLSKSGNMIYTSFPPPGFLAPYFAFKVLGLDLSVANLARFNVIIGSLTAFILFVLLLQLLMYNGHSAWTSVGGSLAGITAAVFSREALISHGVNYWSHSLYQLILVTTLYFLFKYLTGEVDRTRARYETALVVAAFAGAVTEWSAYVFNAGLIWLWWLNRNDAALSKQLAVKVLIATVLAMVLIIVHYCLALGLESSLKGFVGRFLSRQTSKGSIVELLQGYGLSYGLFVLVLIPLLTVSFFKERLSNYRLRITSILFAAACIPMLENIIMLQHATEFSFDRLKLIFPSSFILTFSFAYFKPTGRILLAVSLMAASIHGLKSHREDLRTCQDWINIDNDNQEFVSRISKVVDVATTAFSTSSGVSCYTTLLFHRNIHEHKFFEETPKLVAERNASASVHFEGEWVYSGLPRYTRATITFKDGQSVIMTNDGKERRQPVSSDIGD